MSTSKSRTGELVSAPKPQQLYDIHTKTRAWFSCRALCGVATYTPSFPTRARIWQQVRSDPAAFGHKWFSKAGKDGAALPSPGMPPPSPGLAREDDPAKPFLEPREGSEVQDWIMRSRTICRARRLQATGLRASDTNRGGPALPSAFCDLLPSSFVVLVLLTLKAT